MRSLAPGRGRLTEAGASVLNVAQACAWAALALAYLPRGGHFLQDEAYLYDRAIAVAEALRPAAYGPMASGTNPPLLLPGGACLDLYALPFLFTRDPTAGTRWLIVLSALGALLFDRALARFKAAPFLRVAATTLFLWSVWHAEASDRIWNPHLFLFVTPLLFWLSARLATADRGGAGWAFGWGFAAALAVQLHGSGGIACLLCALLLLPMPMPALAPTLIAASMGFAASFAPYLAAEAHAGFANARHWLGPGLRRHLDWITLRQGIESFALFSSQATHVAPSRFVAPGPGWLWTDARVATFWVAAAMIPFGLLGRGRWRIASAAALAIVPLSLWASGRSYYPHYVFEAYPFLLLPAAAGLAFWAARDHRIAELLSAYLVAFALFGAILLVRTYRDPGERWTVAADLEVTRALLATSPTIRPAPGSLLAAEPLIYEVLARRVLGQPLTLGPRGVLCDLTDLPRPGWRHTAVGRHWLSCAPSSGEGGPDAHDETHPASGP